MARKNNKSGEIVFLVNLAGLISLAKENWELVASIIGVSVALIFVVNIFKYYRKLSSQDRIKKQLIKIINSKIDALARRRAQLVQPDQYGNIVYD